MIAWLFSGLWHIVLGLVLLIGAFGGAAFVLARAIASGQFTDHAASCQCGPCQRRRLKAWHISQANKRGAIPPVATGQVSTRQLRTGDRIEAKGAIYEVHSLVGHPYGIQVFMTRMSTGKKTMVTISSANADRKIWKLAN